MSLSFYDDEAEPSQVLDEFIKGYEILKLRIGKLTNSSKELDPMVPPLNIINIFNRGTLQRGNVHY